MILIYLDPGSGSFLVQLLIASSAGLIIFIGSRLRKIKGLFTKNKAQNAENRDEDEED
jgi:hypothetical protein